MSKSPKFYKNRVSLNILAGSKDNAIECYKAADEYAIIGLLSKNYESNKAAIEDISQYKADINNAISIGLGAGDPNQSKMVAEISEVLQPQHVNQVFTGIGVTRTLLNQNETFINGLVSPTGKIGYVNIATGPLSSKGEKTEVPIDTAIFLLKDMGASSLKFFPMKGLEHIEEYKVVAESCARNNFYLEPTGGLDLDNFETIVQIALDAGVEKIIPHVYSSVIDSETGQTNVSDVKNLFSIMKELDYS